VKKEMSKQETVEVTLRLPKQVVEWFKDTSTESLEKRLEAELVEICYAQIDAATADLLIDKYGLRPVFKEYGLISEAKKNE